MLKTTDLFDLKFTLANEYLKTFDYPWNALSGLKLFIEKLGRSLDKNEYFEVDSSVWVHKSAKVDSSAFLGAPCIVCENAEIRHCAFVRGSVLIGKNCVVGNSTELKNAILFDGVQVPHYNYVGDSILGHKAHMGAGSITSNVKSDKGLVVIKGIDKIYNTGLKKLGAMLGDYVEVGCNTVLNPGVVVGKHSNIYPLSSVRGIIPSNSIYKSSVEIVSKT